MGYFASLARQSGVRFALQRVKPEARTAPPAPLHVEETVMVEAEELATPASVATRVAPAEHTPDQPFQDPREIAEPSPLSPSPSVAAKEEKSESKPIAPQPVPLSNAKEIQRIATADVRASANVAKDEPEPLQETQEVIFVAPRARLPENEFSPKEAFSIAEDRPSKPVQKSYFTRTAEIIDGRETDPVEMQTVLLQEVQEWVADAPDFQLDSSETFTEPSRNEKEALPIKEPEPGVARIGVRRRPNAVHATAQQSTKIEEQTFELSIGTINVVIEGEEKQQPPQPPIRQQLQDRADARQKTGQQGSRLSRHYL